MKIIALIPTKNEAWILESCLTNVSGWADVIIVADQMSTDGTREICARFPKVELIDNPREGHSNMVRWDLLDAARKHEGYNLIVCIDADEIAAPGTLFQSAVFDTYQPGQAFELPWLQLWKTTDQYRTDNGWGNFTKQTAFVDDRIMDYDRQFVLNDHTARIPHSSLPLITLEDVALLHCEFIPFARVQFKQAWYRCNELIAGLRSVRRINNTYRQTLDSETVRTAPVPARLVEGTTFAKSLASALPAWHRYQILDWFDERGIEFFEPLEIWHIPELHERFVAKTGRQPRPVTFPHWLVLLNDVKNRILHG